LSRSRAEAPRPISPNGMEIPGARWVRGRANLAKGCMRWRCRAACCMRAGSSRRRAAKQPLKAANGMGGVGARGVRGWATPGRLCSGVDWAGGALAVSGNDVYAGGVFTTAGGTGATNIAKWNGSSWSALDSGMDGIVYSLAVSGGDLYAGGAFDSAGGVSATKI